MSAHLQQYYEIFKRVPLFAGIEPDELEALLTDCGAQVSQYLKGGIIQMAGEPIDYVGIVLHGRIQVAREDLSGERDMLSPINPGEIFAAVFACVGIEFSPVTVIADTDAEILSLKMKHILAPRAPISAAQLRLVENLLRMIAKRTVGLTDKLNCVSQRTMRKKVETFLFMQQEKARSSSFDISFSRAQMADYLCVDRSALSALLGKMRDEGIISYHKNHFELLAGFGKSH